MLLAALYLKLILGLFLCFDIRTLVYVVYKLI